MLIRMFTAVNVVCYGPSAPGLEPRHCVPGSRYKRALAFQPLVLVPCQRLLSNLHE